jgi:predicted kinase
MLIVMSGLPGVGKTTIAREVGRATRGVHVRIDSIEQALRNSGWDVQAEGYRVAYVVAEDNLRLGRIVVADCVNPLPATQNEWRAVAARAQVGVLDVEVVCSNLDEHRRRVESRVADIIGHALPTWDEIARPDDHARDDERLIVDSATLDVDACVRAILAAIPAHV